MISNHQLHLPMNARAQSIFSHDVKRLRIRVSNFEVFPPKCEVPTTAGVFMAHSVRCQHRQQMWGKSAKNCDTYMESWKVICIKDFLRDLDEDLWIYRHMPVNYEATALCQLTVLASAKYLTENYLVRTPEGKKDLFPIWLAISERQHKTVKGCKLSSPHLLRKVQLLNLQRGKKNCPK